MKKSIVHVSDHALIRYLERVHGVDMETLRRRIGRHVDRNLIDCLPTPSHVNVDGVQFCLRGKTITTVLASSKAGKRRK